MKSRVLFGFILFFWALFALIANIPAIQILRVVELPKNIQAGDISGTVWKGQFSYLVVEQQVLEKVQWDVNLGSLMSAKLGVDWKLGGARSDIRGSGLAEVDMDGKLTVSNSKLSIPAQMLATQLHLPLDVEAKGRVSMYIATGVQGAPYCESLSGTVNWHQAWVSTMGQELDLGRMKAKLGCDQGSLQVITEPSPPLSLEVVASLGQRGRMQVQGTIKPSDDLPPQIKNAFKFLGRPDAQGRYQLSL